MIDHRSVQYGVKLNGNTLLRILSTCSLRLGGNDYAFIRAFRRAGHSVLVVPAENYLPNWESTGLRALRRLVTPLFVAEYNKMILYQAKHFCPDLLFVFKGTYLTKETLIEIKKLGAIAINFYPDTGFVDHGPYLPTTIGHHDWVFTTKSAGVSDLKDNFNFNNSSFIPHAFDPEVHAPVDLSSKDLSLYECDISFLGNISIKKQRVLERLCDKLPGVNLGIWGSKSWGRVPGLADFYRGPSVWGMEYAKAIQASKINLGLLFEGGSGAPKGDQITARTFEIPAAGGFMLHERTEEAVQYFEDGKECVFYSNPDDLANKIRYYLDHPVERLEIAKAGHKRCLSSGYSVDDRVETVLAKYTELRQQSFD